MAGQSLNSKKTGELWEKTAESFLCTHGLKVLERNFSSRFGEIDLIMEHENTIVFVEVRYRKSKKHGDGAESITPEKQSRISRTAGWYLANNPDRAEQFCRFDVVSIDSKQSAQSINWIRDAFYSTIG
jgi:putative endonuclease